MPNTKEKSSSPILELSIKNPAIKAKINEKCYKKTHELRTLKPSFSI